MTKAIGLLVGLGNPGPDYALTRHNAGEWLIDTLLRSQGGSLSLDSKLKARLGRFGDLRLAVPDTFMNVSGQAVGAIARYYKLMPEQIIVAHDDIDLPVGTIRLKKGGGHGGHNGLRDIISHLGTQNFYRFRIGVGRPANARHPVEDYVLKRPSSDEMTEIAISIQRAVDQLPELLKGNVQAVMKTLHT